MNITDLLIPQTFEPLGVWLVYSGGLMWYGLGTIFSKIGEEE